MRKDNDMHTTTIWFDLDGTLYDLYGQPMWLERITTLADVTAYSNPHSDFYGDDLGDVLDALVASGYTIGVITWLPPHNDNGYLAAVEAVKRAWVRRFIPQATRVHVLPYGVNKNTCASAGDVLVDDHADVRAMWEIGDTIDASTNILPALQSLVSE